MGQVPRTSLLHEDEIRSVERSEVDAALRPTSYTGSMLDFSDLDSPDPLRRDLAYLRLLEELLGQEWVEWWALELAADRLLRTPLTGLDLEVYRPASADGLVDGLDDQQISNALLT